LVLFIIKVACLKGVCRIGLDCESAIGVACETEAEKAW